MPGLHLASRRRPAGPLLLVKRDGSRVRSYLAIKHAAPES
jgi:hypothetical protein